jgi:hypothetical protein
MCTMLGSTLLCLPHNDQLEITSTRSERTLSALLRLEDGLAQVANSSRHTGWLRMRPGGHLAVGGAAAAGAGRR